MPPPCTIARFTRSPPRLSFVRPLRARRPPRSVQPANVFLLFIPFPFPCPVIRPSLIFFFSFQRDAVTTNVTSAVSYSSTAMVFGPAVVYVSPGFSTDAQTLFGQIKSLSRRLKVFARGDFKVQFLKRRSTVSF